MGCACSKAFACRICCCTRRVRCGRACRCCAESNEDDYHFSDIDGRQLATLCFREVDLSMSPYRLLAELFADATMVRLVPNKLPYAGSLHDPYAPETTPSISSPVFIGHLTIRVVPGQKRHGVSITDAGNALWEMQHYEPPMAFVDQPVDWQHSDNPCEKPWHFFVGRSFSYVKILVGGVVAKFRGARPQYADNEEREWELDCEEPNGRKTGGTIKVKFTYEFLRGTYDEGGNFGPGYLKLGEMTANSDPNHWCCAHDNVYCLAERSDGKVLQAQIEVANTVTDTIKQHFECTHHGDVAFEHSDVGGEEVDPHAQLTDYVNRADLSQKEVGVRSAERIENATSDEAQDLLAATAGGMARTNTLPRLTSFRDSWVEAMNESPEEMHAVTKKVLCDQASIIRFLASRTDELEYEMQQMRRDMQGGAVDFTRPAAFCKLEHRFGPISRGKVATFIVPVEEWYSPEMNDAAEDADENKRNKLWHKLEKFYTGKQQTDNEGRMSVEIPRSILGFGHFTIRQVCVDTNSDSTGSLFVLRKGTPCVVFDMDGTLTVGDQEVVTQFMLESCVCLGSIWDPMERDGAVNLVRAWVAKGYQPIYLSGRQGSFYRITLDWLLKHRFPPGPIHLTRTMIPTLPIYPSVGVFKCEYMNELKAKGCTMYAAYGNTATDIRAYSEVGFPKERIFMVGPHGGDDGTVDCGDGFHEHIDDVMQLPDAEVPIDYKSMEWGAPYYGCEF